MNWIQIGFIATLTHFMSIRDWICYKVSFTMKTNMRPWNILDISWKIELKIFHLFNRFPVAVHDILGSRRGINQTITYYAIVLMGYYHDKTICHDCNTSVNLCKNRFNIFHLRIGYLRKYMSRVCNKLLYSYVRNNTVQNIYCCLVRFILCCCYLKPI